MKMQRVLQAFVCLSFVLSMAACSTILEHESSSRLAVKYATVKVIDGDQEKAARVEEIARDVRAYASGEKLVTVDLLIAEIRKHIDWDSLDSADTFLVDALLFELSDRLKDRLGPDALPEDLRLTADRVAGWVIDAARIS